jgi:ParB-like chromosome segregation protein Spo0J
MAAIALVRKRKHGLFEKVPCSLFKGNETDARVAQLAANLQRKDMNPAEIADAMRKLVVCGLSQAQIAKSTHLSPSYVSTLLGIREKCSTPVLESLAKGEITVETAGDLGKLDERKQPAALAKHLGVKKERGKAAAKASTANDTGRVVRPKVKDVREMVGKVISRINEKGVIAGSDKSFWTGAMTAIQYLMGDGEELATMAKAIVKEEAA